MSEHKTGVLTITVLLELKIFKPSFDKLLIPTILKLTGCLILTYLSGNIIQYWAGLPVVYFVPIAHRLATSWTWSLLTQYSDHWCSDDLLLLLHALLNIGYNFYQFLH